MRIFLSSLIFLGLIQISFSQDTIYYDHKVSYNSGDNPIRGKEFVANLEFAREDIILDENTTRVEYCYYYDNERICHGNTYRILNDSTLIENESIWNYKKVYDNNFSIWRNDSLIVEYGQASSMMPLQKTGLFFTVNKLSKDTLWQMDYTNYNPSNPYRKPLFNYYLSHIHGKVYEYSDIEVPPTQKDYSSLNSVRITPEYCLSQPYMDITLVTCIITKEGRILNVEQALGGLDKNCPYTLQEIITEISKWKEIKPAKIKGRPVNVRWFITIDNNLRQALHPAFADTPKNRKKFIKSQKRKERKR